jgi:hypothetical protein
MRSRRWKLGGEALAEVGAGGNALAEVKPTTGAASDRGSGGKIVGRKKRR